MTKTPSHRTTRKQTLGVLLLGLLFLLQPLAVGGVACGLDGDCCCSAQPAERQPGSSPDSAASCGASERAELPGGPSLVAQRDRCFCSAVPGPADEPAPLALLRAGGSEREAFAERLQHPARFASERAIWEGLGIPAAGVAAPPDEVRSTEHRGVPWALLRGGVPRLLALLSVALN